MLQKQPKIGLALGAGAARGLAHIGVIKELIKNDISIDYIAGSSIGSVIGAHYALNKKIDMLETKILGLKKRDLLKLIDLSSPIKGLIIGDKIKKFISDILEDKSFANTKITINITATDLYSGKTEIFKSGKLAEACRASISIPGIFIPYKKDDKFLIDGGVLKSTPIDIVKKMGADIIIAVDLPVIKTKESKDSPNIVEALIQSYEIMRKKTNTISENTIIIRPDVSEHKINGYKFLNKEFIEKGSIAAKKAMPKIKKTIKKFNLNYPAHQ